MKKFTNIYLTVATIAIALAMTTSAFANKNLVVRSQTINGIAAPNATNGMVGYATETLTFSPSNNVAAGDTITIGTGLAGRAVYTYTTNTGTNIPVYGVLVGTNFCQSCTNLLQAITGGNTGNGTNFGTNTPANVLVTAAQTASNIITLTATATAISSTPTTSPNGNGVQMGNNVLVNINSISNEIQTPFSVQGLYGGFQNVFEFIPWTTGVGVSITVTGTNSQSVSNVYFVFGVSGVQSNLVYSATNAANPSLAATVACPGAATASWFTNWPTSLVGCANWIGAMTIGNQSVTNYVPYTITYTWSEEGAY